MFAVLKTGGKQYKVKSGDLLRIEKICADAGETVQFNDVLVLGGKETIVGDPLVGGAAVQAKVIGQIKSKKTINFVKRRRKHGSQRTKGHRQNITLVEISDILSKGADKTGVKPASGYVPKEKTPIKVKEDSNLKLAMSASKKADDLTQLSGVGPALLKKLNAAGIHSFAQIAAWTTEDVLALDKRLSLKGRIERDGWIGQSKTLVEKG